MAGSATWRRRLVSMETPETCSDRVVRRVAAAADFGSAGVVARSAASEVVAAGGGHRPAWCLRRSRRWGQASILCRRAGGEAGRAREVPALGLARSRRRREGALQDGGMSRAGARRRGNLSPRAGAGAAGADRRPGCWGRGREAGRRKLKRVLGAEGTAWVKGRRRGCPGAAAQGGPLFRGSAAPAEIGACRGAGRKGRASPNGLGRGAFARVARAEAGSPLGGRINPVQGACGTCRLGLRKELSRRSQS